MRAPPDLTRAYCKVCHSKAAYDHNGCAAPCNICGALHQYYIPVPALPGMNMTERAARAEALAERLAAAFANCPGGSHESMREQQAALDAWTAHRAALEKSAGEGA